jgi:hypothetical protein
MSAITKTARVGQREGLRDTIGGGGAHGADAVGGGGSLGWPGAGGSPEGGVSGMGLWYR